MGTRGLGDRFTWGTERNHERTNYGKNQGWVHDHLSAIYVTDIFQRGGGGGVGTCVVVVDQQAVGACVRSAWLHPSLWNLQAGVSDPLGTDCLPLVEKDRGDMAGFGEEDCGKFERERGKRGVGGREREKETDRQTDTDTDRQTDRQTEGGVAGQRERGEREKGESKERDRQTDRQTDRQRQTDRGRQRQTDRVWGP